MKNLRNKLLLAIAVAGIATQAAAQAWPAKSVRFVVPFAPGSSPDRYTRLLAEKLTHKWGVPVVVENRPGATAMIGTDFVAKQPADGYTFLSTFTSFTQAPVLFPNCPYDPEKDFAPVTQAMTAEVIMAVRSDSPYKTYADLIAAARRDKLSYGSFGNGSSFHIYGETVKRATGIDMTHVAYKGGAPAVQDLVAGQVLVGVIGSTPLIPHHNAGRIKILAFTSKDRFPALPDIPTLHESGFKGFDTGQWLGIVGPRGLPPEVVERLNAESRKALAMADVKERLMKAGLITVGGSAKAFETMMREDIGRWTTMTREMGIQPQ